MPLSDQSGHDVRETSSGRHGERSPCGPELASVECVPVLRSSPPFAGRCANEGLGRRVGAKGFRPFELVRRATRGVREGSRRGCTSACTFARALETRAVLFRRKAAREGHVSSAKSRAARSSPSAVKRCGDVKALHLAKSETKLSRTAKPSWGGAAQARIDSSRTRAHASFVLQKSVGRLGSKKRAIGVREGRNLSRARRIRVNASLAFAVAPRESAALRGARRETENRNGAILITCTPRDRRTLSSARSRNGPPPLRCPPPCGGFGRVLKRAQPKKPRYRGGVGRNACRRKTPRIVKGARMSRCTRTKRSRSLARLAVPRT